MALFGLINKQISGGALTFFVKPTTWIDRTDLSAQFDIKNKMIELTQVKYTRIHLTKERKVALNFKLLTPLVTQNMSYKLNFLPVYALFIKIYV